MMKDINDQIEFNRRSEALDALYACLPKVNCKGLCQSYCGCIGFEKVDELRMTAKAGCQPSTDEKLTCGYLQSDGRCGVYEVRPLVCRLFGAIDELRCPHGCEPEFKLTRQNMVQLAQLVKMVGSYDNRYPTLMNCDRSTWDFDMARRSGWTGSAELVTLQDPSGKSAGEYVINAFLSEHPVFKGKVEFSEETGAHGAFITKDFDTALLWGFWIRESADGLSKELCD